MITIGGIAQKKACELLQVSRNTLFRYRKRKDWPGDDADFEIIQAYVAARRGRGGRPRKSAPTMAPAVTGEDSQEDPAMAELRAALDLDDELKRTIIEKNKAQIRDYQLKCLEQYRADLRKTLGQILDRLVDAIQDANLSPEQTDRLRGTIKAVAREILEQNPQQELGL